MITIRRFALPLAAVFFLAAAPAPVKTQVPGYFRMAVGSFEVTALYDGNLLIGTAILHGADKKVVSSLLARGFADADKVGVRTAINAYLVNTGEHLILVDAGNAGCEFSREVGHLRENLAAAGYRPDEVDVILITHMHGDHVCGMSANGVRVFPNAAVYASEPEAAFWLAPAVANDPRSASKEIARRSLAPYQAANVFHTFKPGAVLFPGVTALDTSGHTPGHASYLFESGGQGFLASGDIVHAGAVQFAHPEVWMEFDVDQKAAVPARRALFNNVAQKGWTISSAHLPFPGIGHIRKDGKAYTYLPVEYAPLP
jgi:glyoxylase-like metal-dependent hydrolase (beta-lactamase superfamily II)